MTVSNKLRTFFLLFAGSILLVLSNGNWSIAIATWLFPVLLIRFFRTRRTAIHLTLGIVSIILAYTLISWLMFTFDALPPIYRLSYGIASGIAFSLPFLADRYLSAKLKGLTSTFVFPFAWVTIEYLISILFGSWYSLAYTQYGNIALMQIVSITGIWGISFLITWFASVANSFLENDFNIKQAKKEVVVYLALFLLVFFYGGMRLILINSDSGTIKVSSILNPDKTFISLFFNENHKDRKAIREHSINEQDYFLNKSIASAKKGAQIVFWQEYAVTLLEEDETDFVNKASAIAQEQEIYLVMVYATLPLGFPVMPWKNKLVWISPEGKIIQEYFKSKPAPPLEPIIPGKGAVPIVNTTFGKIASVICADQNYPNFIRQTGNGKAGLLLVPSLDWKAVSPLHSRMGIFRAIENGCSMIKATGEGLSIAVDYTGATLTTLDYWNNTDNVMHSNVSIINTPTFYSKMGDILAWVSIFGLTAISGFLFFTQSTIDKEK